ncbi:hypothetical protein K439DRAFT_1619158 [Ramaria rubella]|nr:hypothetical protein K439DRAFT_1619158 [Ramaria rubella]
MNNQVPPPVVYQFSTCEKCGKPYGGFRANKGISNLQNLGRLMQMCVDGYCHNVIYHSQPYLTLEAAEQMAAYYNLYAPILPVGVQRSAVATHASVPPAPILSPAYAQHLIPGVPPAPLISPITLAPTSFNGKVNCQGVKHVSKKAKRSGAKCQFRRCAGCCKAEAQTAQASNIVCLECGIHMVHQVQADAPTANVPPIPTQAPAGAAAPVTGQGPGSSGGRLLANSVGPIWSVRSMNSQTEAEDHHITTKEQKNLKIAQNKQITIIIWEDLTVKPIRFQYEVPTFPEFALNSVTNLIHDLGIKPEEYLSTWNPDAQEWETHSLLMSQCLEAGQWLLYRLTHTLTTQLDDNDCPGLASELTRQLHSGKRKCGLESLYIPPSSHFHSACASTSSSLSANTSTALPTSQDVLPPHAPPSSISSTVMTHRLLSNSGAHTQSSSPPPVKHTRTSPEPCGDDDSDADGKEFGSRKWLGEYYVCEIIDGLRYIHESQQQRCKVEDLFEETFKVRFVKSTFIKWHKELRDSIGEELKETFVGYGQTEAGLWPHIIDGIKKDTDDKLPHGASVSSKDRATLSSLSSADSPSTSPTPLSSAATLASGAQSKTNTSTSDAYEDECEEDSTVYLNLKNDHYVTMMKKRYALTLGFMAKVLNSLLHTVPTPHLSQGNSQKTIFDSPYECLFCEGDLPPTLSTHLTNILSELITKSDQSSSTYTCFTHGMNLKTHFCGGHVLELQAASDSQGHGWPAKGDIDFESLPAHIISLLDEINKIVQHPAKNRLFQRLVKQFMRHGAVKTHNVDGLRRRMKYEHAGYYGEQGTTIMYSVLMQLYPEDPKTPAIEPGAVILDIIYAPPLTYHEFISAVLIPNVSIWLIQADRSIHCHWAVAHYHWFHSATYGSLTNPDLPGLPESSSTSCIINPQVMKEGNFKLEPDDNVKIEPDDDVIILSDNMPQATWATVPGQDIHGNAIDFIVID